MSLIFLLLTAGNSINLDSFVKKYYPDKQFLVSVVVLEELLKYMIKIAAYCTLINT